MRTTSTSWMLQIINKCAEFIPDDLNDIVSPCLSDDVLLHQCSAGHQSSKGPVEEAKEGVIIVRWIKPHTSSKLAFISVSATCVNSVNFGVGNTTHIHITSFLY